MVIPLRDDNPTTHFPVVTVLLIAVNVFVYFFVQPHGGQEIVDAGRVRFQVGAEDAFTFEHAAVPCELRQRAPLKIGEIQAHECGVGGDFGELFPHKRIWFAVLESMFLHGSLLHLGGNMLFLWIFGNNVEDRLRPVLYIAFYALAGVAAMAAHFLADPSSTVPVIGASGAIAGVMGVYLVLWPRARVLTVVPLLLFFVVSLPAGFVLILWFAMQFLTNPNSGVAWVAHVGGFVTGVAVGLLARAALGGPGASSAY